VAELQIPVQLFRFSFFPSAPSFSGDARIKTGSREEPPSLFFIFFSQPFFCIHLVVSVRKEDMTRWVVNHRVLVFWFQVSKNFSLSVLEEFPFSGSCSFPSEHGPLTFENPGKRCSTSCECSVRFLSALPEKRVSSIN